MSRIAEMMKELAATYLASGYSGGKSLQGAANAREISEIARVAGFSVPAQLTDLLSTHNGQDAGFQEGLFGGFCLVSHKEICQFYSMHKEIILDEEDDVDDFILSQDGELYFSKWLLSFAVSNDFYLSVHGRTGAVYNFNPHVGSIVCFNSIEETLEVLIDAAKVGKGPDLMRLVEEHGRGGER